MIKGSFSNQHTSNEFIECMFQFVGKGSTWDVETNKLKNGSDVVIKIIPWSQNAAPMDARLEFDFGIYLLFGVAARFEIPFSKTYYTGKDWITELTMLCRAVASGNFTERIIYVRDKPVYSKHQLVLETGKTIRESWGTRPIFPWIKTHATEHHYAGYVQLPAANNA